MKKTLLILSVVLAMGLTATFAYAQVPKIVNEQSKVAPRTNVNYEQWEDWYKERMEWRKSQLDQAVKNKEITQEQGKVWEEHYDYMDNFHRENGYSMPGGGCNGGGYGWNNGNGYGPGMMRGNGWRR